MQLAMRVLELGEAGDPEGVLSLLGQPIGRSTPFAQQRKAYLNLARAIHPDKLPKYGQATKAFQALVRAFELLTSPEPPPEAKGGGGKARAATAIARSNLSRLEEDLKDYAASASGSSVPKIAFLDALREPKRGPTPFRLGN